MDMFSDDGDEEEKEIGTKNTFGLRRCKRRRRGEYLASRAVDGALRDL